MRHPLVQLPAQHHPSCSSVWLNLQPNELVCWAAPNCGQRDRCCPLRCWFLAGSGWCLSADAGPHVVHTGNGPASICSHTGVIVWHTTSITAQLPATPCLHTPAYLLEICGMLYRRLHARTWLSHQILAYHPDQPPHNSSTFGPTTTPAQFRAAVLKSRAGTHCASCHPPSHLY